MRTGGDVKHSEDDGRSVLGKLEIERGGVGNAAAGRHPCGTNANALKVHAERYMTHREADSGARVHGSMEAGFPVGSRNEAASMASIRKFEWGHTDHISGEDPLTTKGKKIQAAMKEQYGAEKGERVFYASINKGNITGAD